MSVSTVDRFLSMDDASSANNMVIERISAEYDHQCVYAPFVERAKCGNCISADELQLYAKNYHSKKQIHKSQCDCHLQESHTVYTCAVCEEVTCEIKYIQSEIVRACSRYGFEVSQSFIVNPTFQDTIADFAFRCRMLNEFLLRQRIKMHNIEENTTIVNEMVDVTDDISVLTFDASVDDTQSCSSESETCHSRVDTYADTNAIYDYSITLHDQPSDLNLSDASSRNIIIEDGEMNELDVSNITISSSCVFAEETPKLVSDLEVSIITSSYGFIMKYSGHEVEGVRGNSREQSSSEFTPIQSNDTGNSRGSLYGFRTEEEDEFDDALLNSPIDFSSPIDFDDVDAYDNLCSLEAEPYTQDDEIENDEVDEDEDDTLSINERFTLDKLNATNEELDRLNELIYLFTQQRNNLEYIEEDYEVPVIEE